MKTFTSEGKHEMQQTALMWLDDLNFVDDLALLPHTLHEIQVKATSVASVSTAIGLNLNKVRTKILKCNSENTNPITLDGQALNEMESFTYHLNSIIHEQGGFDADVSISICKAKTGFLQLETCPNQNNCQSTSKSQSLILTSR
ncbi:unnamed protein product [Schistosoma mattheei]|uniref:Uncharacterized protein n=1 Tax=Schistosoma mattheei TaxID=31246 RepID=A0A183Q3N0_9TREM|nr:unnamed protein product [Schistosoma mattheei]